MLNLKRFLDEDNLSYWGIGIPSRGIELNKYGVREALLIQFINESHNGSAF